MRIETAWKETKNQSGNEARDSMGKRLKQSGNEARDKMNNNEAGESMKKGTKTSLGMRLETVWERD